MTEVTLLTALAGGILSFVSPCVLPLVPGYISFVTGLSIDELTGKGTAKLTRVFPTSLAFVFGFSTVFVVLGASATAIGEFLSLNNPLLRKVAGVTILVFGLHVMGLLTFGFLNYEKRFHLKARSVGVAGAYVVGLAFAFGWTPCIGPILGAILAVAGLQKTVTEGVLLLTVYSVGLGIPFLLTGLATNASLGLFTQIKRYFRIIEIVSGLLLVALGVLIFFDYFSVLSNYLLKLFPWLNIG